jgi:hypothetical protein
VTVEVDWREAKVSVWTAPYDSLWTALSIDEALQPVIFCKQEGSLLSPFLERKFQIDESSLWPQLAASELSQASARMTVLSLAEPEEILTGEEARQRALAAGSVSEAWRGIYEMIPESHAILGTVALDSELASQELTYNYLVIDGELKPFFAVSVKMSHEDLPLGSLAIFVTNKLESRRYRVRAAIA